MGRPSTCSATALPTALAAANDRIAIGLLDAPRRAGVDDSPLARLSHIDLTSVSQEPREQANRAVAAVVERLDGGRTDAVSSVLQPRLVVRDTTAPNHEPRRGADPATPCAVTGRTYQHPGKQRATVSASTSSRVPRLSSPSSVTTAPMSSTSLPGSPRSVGTSPIRASGWSHLQQ